MLKATSDFSNEFLGTGGSRLQDGSFLLALRNSICGRLARTQRQRYALCSCRIQPPQTFHPGKSKGFPSNTTALAIFVTDPDPFRTETQWLAPLLAFQAINLTQPNSQLCCSQTVKRRSLQVLVLEEPKNYLHPVSQKNYRSRTEEQQKQ